MVVVFCSMGFMQTDWPAFSEEYTGRFPYAVGNINKFTENADSYNLKIIELEKTSNYSFCNLCDYEAYYPNDFIIIFVLKIKDAYMKTTELKQKLFRKLDNLEENQMEKLYGLVVSWLNGKKEVEEWTLLSEPEKQGIIEAILLNPTK